MSSRAYYVSPDHKAVGQFNIIVVTTSKSNISKREIKRGYLTEDAAHKDLPKFRVHLQTKTFGTFFATKGGGNPNKIISKKRKRLTKAPTSVNEGNRKPLSGNAYKQHDKHMNLEYRRHVEAVGKKEALDRAHWNEVYNHPAGEERERALRRVSRGTHYRDQYFLETVSSKENAKQLEGVHNAVVYMFDRANQLKSSIDKHITVATNLQRALVKGTPDQFLVRASFDGDLPAEKDIEKSTSKAQLSKVTTQCLLVKDYHKALLQVDIKELKLIEEVIAVIENPMLFDVKRDLMERHVQARKQLHIDESMGVVAKAVCDENQNSIAPKTLRKWYNELDDLGGFKEDLRGCHDRLFFLEEYNYKRRFTLYCKNEKQLSVDNARRGLQEIVAKDPPKTAEGVKKWEGLCPLWNSTVHRWMLMCGCKYTLASATYYTDSHEAESTKKDRQER
jgi:hypothetical protein